LREWITMKWVTGKDMWHMRFLKGTKKFIQEFYDCFNVNHFFPELSKTKLNKLEVTIINVTEKGEFQMGDVKDAVRPNWYVKVTCLVIGPKEGPITADIEYAATTRDMAEGIQNEMGEYFIAKNKQQLGQ